MGDHHLPGETLPNHGPEADPLAVAAAQTPSERALNAIFGLLAAGLTIAALSLGRDLIVPLVLAVMLAFVLAPLVVMLRRLYVPEAVGIVLAVLVAVSVVLGLGMLMARQAGTLVDELPAYQQNMQQKLQSLRLGELMREADLALRDLRQLVGDGIAGRAGSTSGNLAPPATSIPTGFGTTPLDVVQSIAGPVLAPIATAGVVVLFAIVVLIYRENLRDRVIRLAGSRDLHRTTVALNDAAKRLSRLFLAQVVLNAFLGMVVGLILWALGLPSPALWGVLAGLMRFVPFFGTFVAMVPPLLLAVAVSPGWSLALWVFVIFLVMEPLMGQILEPAVFGHSTGISPVAVIIAATFWTFLWGPIGLLLATPLTVCLVVLGRHVKRMAFLDVILGDGPSLLPPESFYQRALQRDSHGLLMQARRQLRKDPSLAAYHDNVSLLALDLADQDWSREVLEPERMEDVRAAVRTLLEGLEPAEAPEGQVTRVVCAAGRGSLDDLAAATARQALLAEGIAAIALAETEEADATLAANARLCCLSVMEEGNSVDGIRYLVRRLQRQLPQASIVVGLWHAEPGSAMLAELRQDTAGETIVTSLRELGALCRALAPLQEAGETSLAATSG